MSKTVLGCSIKIQQALKNELFLFRLDSKTLLQRYNPLSGGGGDSLHKSANLFTGFVQSNRERYASVAVKFVSVDSNSYTVKVIKSASSNDS